MLNDKQMHTEAQWFSGIVLQNLSYRVAAVTVQIRFPNSTHYKKKCNTILAS